jgi:hypothetical protein
MIKNIKIKETKFNLKRKTFKIEYIVQYHDGNSFFNLVSNKRSDDYFENFKKAMNENFPGVFEDTKKTRKLILDYNTDFFDSLGFHAKNLKEGGDIFNTLDYKTLSGFYPITYTF